MRSCLKNNKGFTLIEMVAVAALAAILAAVAIPLYADYKDNARRKEGESAALTVLTAAKVYYYRNNDSFSGSACTGCTTATNNIWLKAPEICNNWSIGYNYGPCNGKADQYVTVTLTGIGDYPNISPLTFCADTGIASN